MPLQVYLHGVPFDLKSSYFRGSAQAPDRIREELVSSSYNMYSERLRPVLSEDFFSDRGNVRVESYEDILPVIAALYNADHPYIFIGGDHSISYPLIKALRSKQSGFHVLHFDAHGDLYDELYGDKFSHGCPFARVMEEGLVESLTQVGIRALTPQQVEQAERFGVQVFGMRDLDSFDVAHLTGPLYISFDMDAFDPAYAPGISHHEPGGLSPRQVFDWLQDIAVPILAADLVEYNPLRDISGMTASLCHKLVKELIDAMVRTNS